MPKDKAIIKGFNNAGKIVYNQEMPILEYYENEHPWDKSENILKMGIVKITGTLYSDAGNISQEFETAFDEKTGKYVGSIGKLADGKIMKDGIYQDTN